MDDGRSVRIRRVENRVLRAVERSVSFHSSLFMEKGGRVPRQHLG